MEWLQRILLVGFVLCAGLTAWQQVRYGMICGRSEQNDPQQDPEAGACRRQAFVYAIGAAVCLALCILVGAINR